MTLFKHTALLVTALIVGTPSIAGRQFGEGHLVEWLPVYETSQQSRHVYAAMGRSILPVVIYDAQTLSQISPAYAKFLLFRQDAVAYLAAEQLRALGEHATPWGSPGFPQESKRRPFSLIDEKLFYGHLRLRGQGPAAFDCVAFSALDDTEQRTLLQAIQTGDMDPGRRLVVWPTQRRLTSDSLRFLRSAECRELANAFE